MEPRTFRSYEPDQILLLPPSLRDWLPGGHLAYFILDVVASLDLSGILNSYGGPARGTVPYDPKMMVGLLLYGYCAGVPSSRRIATKAEENVAFRILAGNQRPDFRTISEFRRIHLEELTKLFVQVLRLCQKAGLVKLGHVALDGTKIKANASKHKAMSYDRMTKEEARLEGEVDRLLREAEAADQREDGVYGVDKRGDELPEELAFREKRLAKIREAKAALEREAVESARGKGDPQAGNAKPEGKAQKNFTDPESRIMPSSSDKGSFVQAYNAQAVVDGANQVIVAEDVTQQANDKKQAVPMMEQAKANNGGEAPAKASLDAGYFSETNILEVEKLGTEAFIPPDRMKHGEKQSDCPRGRIPREASAAERMRRKLTTKRGRRIYAERKKIVEPVFGQIKQGRGFRQFLMRGLAKVKGEWSLICTTHNLLKLWRSLGVTNGGPPGRVDWAVG
jgi:transposase